MACLVAALLFALEAATTGTENSVSDNPLDDIDLSEFNVNGAKVIAPEDAEAEKEALARSERIVGRWKLRGLADAYADRPPLLYLVDGLLPCPSLSIVYGGPGSLKSMLLADLAIAIAAGGRWLEPLPNSDREPGVTFQTLQAPVLWVDFDNGEGATDGRMEAFARARQLAPDAPLHYVSMPQPWLDASKTSMARELAELVDERKAKFVVLDNLGLISGSTDENSGQMSQVMGNLRWLCEETKSAVTAVHHQRKSGGSADKGIRKGETLRGHSSIEASLDLALLVERKEGEDSIAIIATKVRGFIEQGIFGAHFTYEHKPSTKELAMARFYSLQVSSKEEREIEAIEGAIKATLRKQTLNSTGVVNAARDTLAALPGGTAPGVAKVRGILKRMVEEKAVIEDGNGGGRVYRLI